MIKLILISQLLTCTLAYHRQSLRILSRHSKNIDVTKPKSAKVQFSPLKNQKLPFTYRQHSQYPTLKDQKQAIFENTNFNNLKAILPFFFFLSLALTQYFNLLAYTQTAHL